MTEPLFEKQEYDLLEKIFQLSESLLKDAEENWNTQYFGDFTPKTIQEYRERIERIAGSSQNT